MATLKRISSPGRSQNLVLSLSNCLGAVHTCAAPCTHTQNLGTSSYCRYDAAQGRLQVLAQHARQGQTQAAAAHMLRQWESLQAWTQDSHRVMSQS